MIYDINGFIKGEPVLDGNGEPVVDSDYKPKMSKPTIEDIPFDKIAKAREDIEFILANKDKI